MWAFLRPCSPPASSPAPIRPSRLVAIKNRMSEQGQIQYPSPGNWRGRREHWSVPDPPLTDTGWRRRPRGSMAQAISSDSDDAVEEKLLVLPRTPERPPRARSAPPPSAPHPPETSEPPGPPSPPASSPVVSDEWAYRSQANAGVQEGGWNCSAALGTIVAELPPFLMSLGCSRPACGCETAEADAPLGCRAERARRPVDDLEERRASTNQN